MSVSEVYHVKPMHQLVIEFHMNLGLHDGMELLINLSWQFRLAECVKVSGWGELWSGYGITILSNQVLLSCNARLKMESMTFKGSDGINIYMQISNGIEYVTEN